jgi:hypothetical protein
VVKTVIVILLAGTVLVSSNVAAESDTLWSRDEGMRVCLKNCVSRIEKAAPPTTEQRGACQDRGGGAARTSGGVGGQQEQSSCPLLLPIQSVVGAAEQAPHSFCTPASSNQPVKQEVSHVFTNQMLSHCLVVDAQQVLSAS